MSISSAPTTARLSSLSVDSLAELFKRELDAWLSRDERIVPVLTVGELNPEQDALRRQDERRRTCARTNLRHTGRLLVESIVPFVRDAMNLNRLLDCVARDDSMGAERLRPDVTALIEEAAIRQQLARRTPRGGNSRSRLAEIPDELRAAAFEIRDFHWSPGDALTAGSRLLLESIQLGAFSEERFAGLRTRVNLVRHKSDADVMVIVDGIGWLVENGHLPGVAGCVQTTLDAMKGVLADLIASYAAVVPDRVHRRRRNDRAIAKSDPIQRIIDALTPKQCNVLKVLLKEQAFDRPTCWTADEIADAVSPKQGTGSQFKTSIASLGKLRLLNSRRSRGGGSWLTPRGREVATRLTDKSKPI